MRRPELVARLAEAWRDHTRRHRDEVVSWAGGWWRAADDLEAVKQAAKYPSPAAMLSSSVLPEWLAVARGRRWHDGSGLLRGALRQSAEAAEGADRPDDGPELGPVVCVTRPGAAPDLDAVVPGLGLPVALADDGARPLVGAWCRWQVAAAWQGSPELGQAVEARGWRWSIGPAAGQPEDVTPRPAAEGEAPDAPGLALWIEAPALDVAAELVTLPAGGPIPKARPPRRRRRGALRRGSRR
jgi:hypothetical protein